MARGNNLPSKAHKAGERTHTRLHFKWDAGDGNSTSTIYVDIAQCLSMLNRRAYRQGLYYYVAAVGFSNNTEAYCEVNTLPDTWITKAAWLRGFRKWSEMNRRANDHSDVTPKYHDFKTQMTSTSAAVCQPVAYGDIDSSTNYSVDDWVLSKFVTDDPYLHGGAASDTPVEAFNADAFTSHMLGGHYGTSGAWTSISLIRSYADTKRDAGGAAAGSPELDGDASIDPLANLFDSSDTHDDVRANMDVDNDEPPYNSDLMTGEYSVEETTVGAVMRTSAGAGAFVRAPGLCAPLGLLQVNVSDFSAGTSVGPVALFIDLVPGSYHGVHAERVI